MSEAVIKVASKLYQMRDAAKVLLGDRYREEMGKFGETLRSLSRTTNVSVLEVAQDWAKAAARDGSSDAMKLAIIIFAAAVEILEPSEAAA